MTYKILLLILSIYSFYTPFLKIFLAMKQLNSHNNSCLYPRPLLTNANTHTHEHLYSRTYARTHEEYTRNALNTKRLNFGFLYEWDIIIPSPSVTRLVVPIPSISLIYKHLVWLAVLSLCVHFACKCVICSGLCSFLVRVPNYRVSWVWEVCEFLCLWLYV